MDVTNIYITDLFLGGRFIKYGTQVINYYSHSPSLRRDLPNPMCTVFPTVTRYDKMVIIFTEKMKKKKLLKVCKFSVKSYYAYTKMR